MVGLWFPGQAQECHSRSSLNHIRDFLFISETVISRHAAPHQISQINYSQSIIT
jgi:hypothetical protein